MFHGVQQRTAMAIELGGNGDFIVLLLVCSFLILCIAMIVLQVLGGWPPTANRKEWWRSIILTGAPAVFLYFLVEHLEPVAVRQQRAEHLLFTVGSFVVSVAVGCGLMILASTRLTPPHSR